MATPPPPVTLQPARPEDTGALAAFLTALHPDTPHSAESLRRTDAGRLPGEHHAVTLAWQEGALVGMVETERARRFTRPGWYGLHVHATDDALRDQLYRHGLHTLGHLDPPGSQVPVTLHTTVREHWLEASWLQRLSWQEHERMWISTLDLRTFTPDAFTERRARADREGVRVQTLADLGWDDSELLQRRYYTLVIGLLADVPTTDPIDPWPFEVWRARIVQSPDFRPDGPLIATHGEDWIGMTELYVPHPGIPGTLHQGLTGVRREWRGRGAAWALELSGAERARAQGWTHVRTGNHVTNREMLGINDEMGFVREPASVVLTLPWPANP